MKRIIVSIYILSFISLLFISFFSCKKAKNAPAIEPSKAVLVFPSSNAACTEGRELSSSQSAILFKWNSSENAVSYVLNVKNLLNGAINSQSTSMTELELTLERNTPYSWNVVSKSHAVAFTSQSDTWKFFNAGLAAQSFAPFPAEALSPVNGQQLNTSSSKITLDWSADDVDGDIANYDVYMGVRTSSLTLLHANVSVSMLSDVSVNPNTSYYWKVITRDSEGNTSSSGIFYFRLINNI